MIDILVIVIFVALGMGLGAVLMRCWDLYCWKEYATRGNEEHGQHISHKGPPPG